MARAQVHFLLNGRPQTVTAPDPTLSVLAYLRYDKGKTGTKEGCAEGDCGACTIVVGTAGDDGAVRYEAVNACIMFVPFLDGKAVWTVEGVRGADGGLHPVQQALVDCHGSQCGFCTPGFVMTLFAAYLNGGTQDGQPWYDELAGNLCRCTGYGPILAAAARVGDYPEPPAPDEADALAALPTGDLLGYRYVCPLSGRTRHYFAPTTPDALAGLAADHPGATFVAGATDVGLWVTKQHRALETVISVRSAGLDRVTDSGTAVRLEAGVSLTGARRVLGPLYPDLDELLRRFASVQIRNSGTLGGNIANGSPIGDSMPALIALGATLVLRHGDNRRRMPLEDFFLDYGKQDRRPGEIVEAVEVPKPRPGQLFRAYKISKRFDQDISAVCGCFSVVLDQGQVTEARLCYGGMAGTPRRAAQAEAALTGQWWSDETIGRAMAALANDFTPLNDMRASASYRLTVAQNLVQKMFLESQEGAPATRVLAAREAAYG